ncbi:hypothetical protein [Dyella humicola]|uniref:hypothetical protein n=1 Tax=Dyella humicola TaxID=2992126 RepID=UPI00225B81E1|nr:hypothetical protein [Dyella humicola]
MNESEKQALIDELTEAVNEAKEAGAQAKMMADALSNAATEALSDAERVTLAIATNIALSESRRAAACAESSRRAFHKATRELSYEEKKDKFQNQFINGMNNMVSVAAYITAGTFLASQARLPMTSKGLFLGISSTVLTIIGLYGAFLTASDMWSACHIRFPKFVANPIGMVIILLVVSSIVGVPMVLILLSDK